MNRNQPSRKSVNHRRNRRDIATLDIVVFVGVVILLGTLAYRFVALQNGEDASMAAAPTATLALVFPPTFTPSPNVPTPTEIVPSPTPIVTEITRPVTVTVVVVVTATPVKSQATVAITPTQTLTTTDPAETATIAPPPTNTPTRTPVPSATPTPAATPTATQTPSPTSSPTVAATATATATITPLPTATPSPTTAATVTVDCTLAENYRLSVARGPIFDPPLVSTPPNDQTEVSVRWQLRNDGLCPIETIRFRSLQDFGYTPFAPTANLSRFAMTTVALTLPVQTAYELPTTLAWDLFLFSAAGESFTNTEQLTASMPQGWLVE